MQKKELIRHIAEQTGETIKSTKLIINTMLNTIIDPDTYNNDPSVILTGFGTFKIINVPACTRRNPSTGGTVECPEKNKIKFVPGKGFKAVNA